jgi:hypothetical protein
LTERSRRSAERLAHVKDAPAGEVPERVDLLQILVSRAVEEPALGHVEEAQHVDVEVLLGAAASQLRLVTSLSGGSR